jgi:hypothetical protein
MGLFDRKISICFSFINNQIAQTKPSPKKKERKKENTISWIAINLFNQKIEKLYWC